MPVLKEYLCLSCGPVENTLPVCPRCGSTEPNLKREFRTAFGVKGEATKFKDGNIRGLVEGAGLTDYSNNINTKHTPDYSKVWGDKKEFAAQLKANPAVAGGINVEETRKALRKIGGVTKIYDQRDIKGAA